MDGFVIVRQHPDLINYIDGLQKKNAESLSFYPKAAFEREALKGRLFLGLLNGEPCGYIYVGAVKHDMRCHQVCIQYDARRRLYGAALVAEVEAYAESLQASTITLRCGFDLAANDFWKSLGYFCIQIEDGGIRRMRKINIWRKVLDDLGGIVTLSPIEPARGKVDPTVWRKHKKTGIVTQFNRGKTLSDYRSEVIERSKEDDDLLW